MNKQFVTATYQVKEDKQDGFINLMKQAETIMREEKLISSNPVFRMRSLTNPELLIEIFEWIDAQAFERAQQNPKVLSIWGQFQASWIDGGFGLIRFPESNQPWAQFSSIH